MFRRIRCVISQLVGLEVRNARRVAPLSITTVYIGHVKNLGKPHGITWRANASMYVIRRDVDKKEQQER